MTKLTIKEYTLMGGMKRQAHYLFVFIGIISCVLVTGCGSDLAKVVDEVDLTKETTQTAGSAQVTIQEGAITGASTIQVELQEENADTVKSSATDGNFNLNLGSDSKVEAASLTLGKSTDTGTLSVEKDLQLQLDGSDVGDAIAADTTAELSALPAYKNATATVSFFLVACFSISTSNQWTALTTSYFHDTTNKKVTALFGKGLAVTPGTKFTCMVITFSSQITVGDNVYTPSEDGSSVETGAASTY